MSGIARAREKMKKKISFGDYRIDDKKAVDKVRSIYCVPKDRAKMLKEIFAKRVESGTTASIADLLSEAIQLLYNQENILKE